jgi:SynChlorMet cassette protein ScmD
MADSTKPLANTSIVLREEFDDWAVLFDPDSGNAFGLNPTSVFIWKLLDGKNTPEDIMKEIHKNCDDVPEDADKHLRDFLQDLVERGFVGYETQKV